MRRSQASLQRKLFLRFTFSVCPQAVLQKPYHLASGGHPVTRRRRIVTFCLAPSSSTSPRRVSSNRKVWPRHSEAGLLGSLKSETHFHVSRSFRISSVISMRSGLPSPSSNSTTAPIRGSAFITFPHHASRPALVARPSN